MQFLQGNKWEQQKFMRARVIAQAVTFTAVFLSMAAHEKEKSRDDKAKVKALIESPSPAVVGSTGTTHQAFYQDPDYPWDLL